MSVDPFAGPYTRREKWGRFKARWSLRLCVRGFHQCRTCRSDNGIDNSITWNGGNL